VLLRETQAGHFPWPLNPQPLSAMYAVLKPGGHCYLRLRDTDFLIEPRYTFRGEKHVPHDRIICVDDWDFENDNTVVSIEPFLRQDQRYQDHRRWQANPSAIANGYWAELDTATISSSGLARHDAFHPVARNNAQTGSVLGRSVRYSITHASRY